MKTPKTLLPDEVLSRKKTGFTAPIRKWLIESGEINDNNRWLRGFGKKAYSLYQESI